MFDLVSFIPRAVAQSIPLLYGSTGETITEKSGNLNLGIPGVMYVGAISGVIGSFLYEQSTDNVRALPAILIRAALADIFPGAQPQSASPACHFTADGAEPIVVHRGFLPCLFLPRQFDRGIFVSCSVTDTES